MEMPRRQVCLELSTITIIYLTGFGNSATSPF